MDGFAAQKVVVLVFDAYTGFPSKARLGVFLHNPFPLLTGKVHLFTVKLLIPWVNPFPNPFQAESIRILRAYVL